jgi:deazaflavin-dependent oxidoreductase (nitroreductase family)
VTPEDLAALRKAEEIVLVTTGRRSGRPHAVTLWSAYEDGALWLRTDSDADWYRNLVADPRCRVRFDGHEVDATYEPIADRARGLRQLIDLWRKKYGNEWVGDWYVERGRIPVRVRVVTAA